MSPASPGSRHGRDGWNPSTLSHPTEAQGRDCRRGDCTDHGEKSLSKLVRQMYGFYGPVDFVRMGLRYVYYKLMNRLARVWRTRRFYSIRQVC